MDNSTARTRYRSIELTDEHTRAGVTVSDQMIIAH